MVDHPQPPKQYFEQASRRLGLIPDLKSAIRLLERSDTQIEQWRKDQSECYLTKDLYKTLGLTQTQIKELIDKINNSIIPSVRIAFQDGSYLTPYCQGCADTWDCDWGNHYVDASDDPDCVHPDHGLT